MRSKEDIILWSLPIVQIELGKVEKDDQTDYRFLCVYGREGLGYIASYEKWRSPNRANLKRPEFDKRLIKTSILSSVAAALEDALPSVIQDVIAFVTPNGDRSVSEDFAFFQAINTDSMHTSNSDQSKIAEALRPIMTAETERQDTLESAALIDTDVIDLEVMSEKGDWLGVPKENAGYYIGSAVHHLSNVIEKTVTWAYVIRRLCEGELIPYGDLNHHLMRNTKMEEN